MSRHDLETQALKVVALFLFRGEKDKDEVENSAFAYCWLAGNEGIREVCIPFKG